MLKRSVHLTEDWTRASSITKLSNPSATLTTTNDNRAVHKQRIFRLAKLINASGSPDPAESTLLWDVDSRFQAHSTTATGWETSTIADASLIA